LKIVAPSEERFVVDITLIFGEIKNYKRSFGNARCCKATEGLVQHSAFCKRGQDIIQSAVYNSWHQYQLMENVRRYYQQ